MLPIGIASGVGLVYYLTRGGKTEEVDGRIMDIINDLKEFRPLFEDEHYEEFENAINQLNLFIKYKNESKYPKSLPNLFREHITHVKLCLRTLRQDIRELEPARLVYFDENIRDALAEFCEKMATNIYFDVHSG